MKQVLQMARLEGRNPGGKFESDANGVAMGPKPVRNSTRESIVKNPVLWAGLCAAIALTIFVIVTDAPAYAGTASETCANCHVMDSMYENYFHAPHHAGAECADCHLPHGNLVQYYVEKGRQGMHDVYVFGTGQAPAVIRLSSDSEGIVQNNCIRCHAETVELMLSGAQPFERSCWKCHRDAAHGPRGGAAAPYQDSGLYLQEKGD